MTDNDERAFRASLASAPGIFTQLATSFSGPVGRLALVAYAMAILFFLAFLWTACRTMAAPDLREEILWLGAAIACWTTVLTIKLWIWNRINTLEILRALHRAGIER